MLRRFAPALLLILLGGAFFAPLVVHPDQVLFSDHSDMLAMHLPMKRFLVRSWQENGQLPRWCHYSFSGMPFLSDVQVAAFYPLHAPLLWLREELVGTAMSWLVLLHIIIAGLSMYAYARHRGLEIAGSLAAALVFMFAGKWLLHILVAGHYIMIPLAWLPLVLLFFERSVTRRSLADAVYAGALFAMIILGTHPQVTLYAGLVAASWSFCVFRDDWRDRRSRTWVVRWLTYGVMVAVTATLLSAVQLLPSMEAAGQASRGIGVPVSEILGTFGYAVREFFGPQEPPTWEGSGGWGPVAFSLLLLAPILRPGRFRCQLWCFAGLLIFSMGGAAVVQWLPVFRLFQIPVRMLLPAAFPAAFLCGVSADACIQGAAITPRIGKVLWATFGIALLINLLSWPNLFVRESKSSLTDLIPLGCYWLVDGACAAMLFWIVRNKVGRSDFLRCSLLLGCLLAESWTLTLRFVAVRPIEAIYPLNPVVQRLAEAREISVAQGPWRVLDRCVPNEASLAPLGSALPMFGSVRIEPVLGYNSFDVRRYKEFLQMVAGETEPLQPRQGLFGFPISDVFPIAHKSLLDLLGTKYLLQPHQPNLLDSDPEGPGSISSWRLVEVFEKPGQTYSFLTGGMAPLPSYALYENTNVAPRAFMVHDWQLLDSSRRLAQMAETDFRQVVLIEEDSGVAPLTRSNATDSIEFESSSPDRICLQVRAGAPGFLVLAESAYRGWSCKVDYSKTRIHRADYAFQAVFVPAGSHKVIFEFDPPPLQVGATVSCVGLLGLMLVGISGIVPRRKRKPPTDSQHGIVGEIH
ncbi:MAG TPA: hypothetical protein VGP68_15645 [Gemmataceae bacterium]|nr:hypothetical protein [Gemmataceae bacterium]